MSVYLICPACEGHYQSRCIARLLHHREMCVCPGIGAHTHTHTHTRTHSHTRMPIHTHAAHTHTHTHTHIAQTGARARPRPSLTVATGLLSRFCRRMRSLMCTLYTVGYNLNLFPRTLSLSLSSSFRPSQLSLPSLSQIHTHTHKHTHHNTHNMPHMRQLIKRLDQRTATCCSIQVTRIELCKEQGKFL